MAENRLSLRVAVVLTTKIHLCNKEEIVSYVQVAKCWLNVSSGRTNKRQKEYVESS